MEQTDLGVIGQPFGVERDMPITSGHSGVFDATAQDPPGHNGSGIPLLHELINSVIQSSGA